MIYLKNSIILKASAKIQVSSPAWVVNKSVEEAVAMTSSKMHKNLARCKVWEKRKSDRWNAGGPIVCSVVFFVFSTAYEFLFYKLIFDLAALQRPGSVRLSAGYFLLLFNFIFYHFEISLLFSPVFGFVFLYTTPPLY